MHRTIIPASAVSGDRITMTEPAEVHHLVRVLRVKAGASIECVDGHGHRYTGRVVECHPTRVVVAVSRRTEAAPSTIQVTLAQALIKPERFDWAIQKATELGVERIIPLVTARSVIRLTAEHAERKVTRWQRIVREATTQCGRATIPEVEAPCRLDALTARFSDWVMVLMPTLAIATRPVKEALEPVARAASVLVLIGPEGDFTDEEARLAQQHGAIPVSLGRLTLRSETATLATLAILQHTTGFGGVPNSTV